LGLERIPVPLRTALASPDFGSSAMLILSYGHDKYDGGGRPISKDGKEAFKRYALSVARFHPRVRYLEIWNEWNHAIGVRDGSKGTADGYVQLVASVVPALRAAGIQANIVVGALADDFPDWTFARELVRRGVLNHADAFSVHLYNYSAGENAVPQEMLARIERLQDILRAGNGGKDFPVLVTEFGWPTHVGKGGISERQAGAYLAQFLFEAAAYPWLRGVWLYELFDSGPSKSEREHQFGLIRDNGSPKENACFVQGALKLLRDSQFGARGVTRSGARWLHFLRDEASFLIVYSPGREKSREVSIRQGINTASAPLCKTVALRPNAADPGNGWEQQVVGPEPRVFFLRNRTLIPQEVIR
jgi:polysaccharide biosynthesis protein PslG